MWSVGVIGSARYVLLMVYSALLSLPFMLMFSSSCACPLLSSRVVGEWCAGVMLLTREDPLYPLYFLFVVVADHAILHYINGMTLVKLDDEEVKEKTD